MTAHHIGQFTIIINDDDGSVSLRGEGMGGWKFREDQNPGSPDSGEVVAPFLRYVTGLVKAAPGRRVFIDMDGVLADFAGRMRDANVSADSVKRTPGHYAAMLPVPGALDAVRAIIAMGYDVWLATKPPTGSAHAYSEKAAWVFQYLPELKRKLIITPDKGMLGGPGDFLIDDRLHKANCAAFPGTLIDFKEGDAGEWPRIIKLLRSTAPALVEQVLTCTQ